MAELITGTGVDPRWTEASIREAMEKMRQYTEPVIERVHMRRADLEQLLKQKIVPGKHHPCQFIGVEVDLVELPHEVSYRMIMSDDAAIEVLRDGGQRCNTLMTYALRAMRRPMPIPYRPMLATL